MYDRCPFHLVALSSRSIIRTPPDSLVSQGCFTVFSWQKRSAGHRRSVPSPGSSSGKDKESLLLIILLGPQLYFYGLKLRVILLRLSNYFLFFLSFLMKPYERQKHSLKKWTAKLFQNISQSSKQSEKNLPLLVSPNVPCRLASHMKEEIRT